MIHRAVSASLVTFEREIYDYRKNIFYFALRNLIQPVFFVLVIGVGLGSMVNMPGQSSYLQFMLPGILMMCVVQVCYQHFSSEIWMSKNHEGYLELLTMAAPIKPREAVAGYLLTGIVIAFFAVLCFLLPVWLFLPGFQISLSVLILFTIGLALFFTSAGIVVGVSVLDPPQPDHGLHPCDYAADIPVRRLLPPRYVPAAGQGADRGYSPHPSHRGIEKRDVLVIRDCFCLGGRGPGCDFRCKNV